MQKIILKRSKGDIDIDCFEHTVRITENGNVIIDCDELFRKLKKKRIKIKNDNKHK